MRKFALGAAPVRGNWNPKIKPSATRAPITDDLPQGSKQSTQASRKARGRDSNAATYFPPVKGAPRMERLRHYSHRNAALLLDAWPTVTDWTADTGSISVEEAGEAFEFRPDFIVHEDARSYALSIQEGGSTQSAKRSKRTRLIRASLERQGMAFTAMTRSELENHPDLSTAMDLFYYRHWDWPSTLPFQVATTAEEHAPGTLGELYRRLGDAATWPQLLSLASNGYLHLDIRAGLGPHTPLLACRTRGWQP